MIEMMGKMFENMSKEDKKQMLNSMMDQFFKGMPEEDTMEMMMEMMPKMMNSTQMMKNMCNPMGSNPGGMQSMFNFMMGKETNNNANNEDNNYEVLKVKKTNNACSLCENYVKENSEKPIVVMSCEGACIRGEIARKAANAICHTLAPEKTVRLCLGSALTKDSGQRSLVKNAKKLIALEGCPVDCSSRLLKGLMENIQIEVIRTDELASFNKSLFGTNELSEEETNKCALAVAKKIVEKI